MKIWEKGGVVKIEDEDGFLVGDFSSWADANDWINHRTRELRKKAQDLLDQVDECTTECNQLLALQTQPRDIRD